MCFLSRVATYRIRWILSLCAGAGLACATNYAGTFEVHPPGQESPIEDADIETAKTVAGEVAAEFGMTRNPEHPPEIQEYLLRGEYGYYSIVAYEKIPKGSASSVLVFVHLAKERDYLTITVRDLGRSSETERTRPIRLALEERLREAFPGYGIEFAASEIDASFAP